MCTVTYLPLQPAGIILTSTRDEKTIRKPAIPPKEYEVHGKPVVYPMDQGANGTWIVSTHGGFSLCLLNGGFIYHESKPPYRLSRGIMMLDFLKYCNVGLFRDSYNFSGIEPFTFLIVGSDGRSLDELRWNGKNITHTELNPVLPWIWSSVTLYSEEVINLRKKWFEQWLKDSPDFVLENAVNFHKKGGTGDQENDILMNRDNIVRTVSITSIFRNESQYEMYYEDILEKKITRLNLSGDESSVK